MRDLLVRLNHAVWPQISTIMFFVGFLSLIVWVCLPSRKEKYESYARLPLDSTKE